MVKIFQKEKKKSINFILLKIGPFQNYTFHHCFCRVAKAMYQSFRKVLEYTSAKVFFDGQYFFPSKKNLPPILYTQHQSSKHNPPFGSVKRKTHKGIKRKNKRKKKNKKNNITLNFHTI